MTVVVGGRRDDETDVASDAEADAGVDERIVRLLAEGKRPKEIAATLARETSVPRRTLYARAVALRDEPQVERS